MVASSSSTPVILRATARHRVAAYYAVVPERLAARLPDGLRPDPRDGQAYVRLVGVHLMDVRVLGLSGPGVRRVPAVELQALVRRPGGGAASRGTLTLQAFVPRRRVAWAARGLYGESVAVASMQPVWTERGGEIELTYRFDRAGREQRLRVVAQTPPVAPAPDAPAVFLQERPWRYTDTAGGGLRRARLNRPRGPLYRVREHHVTVRWGAVFGPDWAILADRAPQVVVADPGGPLALHWRESVPTPAS